MILKKAISLLLCVLMTLSCFSVAVSAADETDFTYSLKYYTDKNDKYNADVALDKVDQWLQKKNYVVTVKIIATTISFDLTSINSICKTVDSFKDLLSGASLKLLRPVIGDLAALNLSSWQTGMKRGSADITIIQEVIELLYANKEIVRKLCDGSLNAGILTEKLNLEKFVGPDGIGGFVKKKIIGLVYEADSYDFNKAYEDYKDNIDAFIYGELLNKYAEEYLPGFTMDEYSTVEDLICIVFGLVVEKYVAPYISKIDIDTENSPYEALRALHGLINLKGSTYDLSGITFDPDVDFLSQVNNVIGEIFSQIIPGYSWVKGNYDKISENIEGAFKYLGKQSGLIPHADSLSFDEIVMQVVSIILNNIKIEGLGNGVDKCENLEDTVKVALINLAATLGIDTEYTNEDTYLLVLGDIAAHYLYSSFSVTDLKGNDLRPGMGYDIFEVANFAFNYLLFDKKLADFMGLSVSKSADVFTKADKILDYFGETKTKGVSFDSEKFLLGSGSTKGLLEAAFDLDIEYIIEITAVPALKTAGDVSAVKFIYNSLRYFINNVSGEDMIPAYIHNAFNNALGNENIAKAAEYLIGLLSSRNASFITFAGFVCGVIFRGDGVSLGKVTARVSDTSYTGRAAIPEATVVLAGKTLVQGKDYVVVSGNTDIGKAKAVIKGIGLYSGTSKEYDFNIVFGSITGLKATVSGDTAVLSWNELAGAEKYIVSNGSESFETSQPKAEIKVNVGESYSFSVCGVSASGEYSKAATVSVKAEAPRVTGLTVANKTTSIVSLVWDIYEGADEYSVMMYDEKTKAWKEVATPVVNMANISRLSSGTEYQFKVCSVDNTAEGSVKGEYSDVISVTTDLGKVTSVKASTKTSSKVKLSWSKTTGAEKYAVYLYKNSKWTKIKTTSSTSYTVTGLSAGTVYKFKVCAYNSDTGYGADSSVLSVRTNLKKVTGITTKKTAASYIKLSWSKVSSADKYIVYIYEDGEWVKYKTTTSTSMTVKGLSSSKTYKFRVKAYSSSKNVYSDWSSTHSARTRVAQVKNLKAASKTETSVKLTWSKVTGATGYVAYYSTDGKKWTKISSTKKNTITAKKLKSGKTYYFKVRAYYKPDNKAIYGSYSSVLKTKTK